MEAFIISSNIRFSTHDDGSHAWPLRKKILAGIYHQYSPLLIGTQEGRKPQLHELKLLLSGYALADTHRNWLAERMYPCIFYNERTVRLLKSGDFWLSLTPEIDGSSSFDSMFPRLCTWVHIEVAGRELLVFNTHLDHVQPSTRESQIEVLCTQVKRINTKNLPIIIMGDFNDSPESRTRKIIYDYFDSIRDDWSSREEASHHPFTGLNPDGQRIDWILHNLEEKAQLHLDKQSDNGTWPSDHFPLIAKLKF